MIGKSPGAEEQRWRYGAKVGVGAVNPACVVLQLATKLLRGKHEKIIPAALEIVGSAKVSLVSIFPSFSSMSRIG